MFTWKKFVYHLFFVCSQGLSGNINSAENRHVQIAVFKSNSSVFQNYFPMSRKILHPLLGIKLNWFCPKGPKNKQRGFLNEHLPTKRKICGRTTTSLKPHGNKKLTCQKQTV